MSNRFAKIEEFRTWQREHRARFHQGAGSPPLRFYTEEGLRVRSILSKILGVPKTQDINKDSIHFTWGRSATEDAIKIARDKLEDEGFTAIVGHATQIRVMS